MPKYGQTIPHRNIGRFGAGHVVLRPASPGTGVIAGGGVRAVLELAGIRDVLSKSIGSQNPINLVKATMNGLTTLRRPEQVAKLRGLSVNQVLGIYKESNGAKETAEGEADPVTPEAVAAESEPAAEEPSLTPHLAMQRLTCPSHLRPRRSPSARRQAQAGQVRERLQRHAARDPALAQARQDRQDLDDGETRRSFRAWSPRSRTSSKSRRTDGPARPRGNRAPQRAPQAGLAHVRASGSAAARARARARPPAAATRATARALARSASPATRAARTRSTCGCASFAGRTRRPRCPSSASGPTPSR